MMDISIILLEDLSCFFSRILLKMCVFVAMFRLLRPAGNCKLLYKCHFHSELPIENVEILENPH